MDIINDNLHALAKEGNLIDLQAVLNTTSEEEKKSH